MKCRKGVTGEAAAALLAVSLARCAAWAQPPWAGSPSPPLPVQWQFLVDPADYVQNYLPYFMIGLVALTGAAIALYSCPPGRLGTDRVALRVPIIGVLFRLAATAIFSRSLGILIRSGIRLLEALRTAEHRHRHCYLANRVAFARDAVMQRKTLAELLRDKNAYMPMLAAMVTVGESTGTLDDVFEVAWFHASQLQAAIRRFSAIVEPVINVVIGSIGGFVCNFFFVAMFSAAGAGR